MTNKLLCGLFCLILVLGSACSKKAEESKVSAPRPRKTHAVADHFVVLEVPADKMREAMINSHRLRPDSRFLKAFDAIDQITGRQPSSPTAELATDHWIMKWGNSHVATLPLYPDFPDMLGVLVEYARSQNLTLSPDPATPPRASGFLAARLLQQLKEIDERWKSRRSAPLLGAASTALCYLSLQAPDQMEVGELLPAHALGTLALRKAFTKDNTSHDECLLSYAMGYSRFAESLALRMSGSDAARMYVLKEDDKLQAAVNQHPTDEARYYLLCRLAQKDMSGEWERTLNKLFPGASFSPLSTGVYLTATRQVESYDVEALGDRIAEAEWNELNPGNMRPQSNRLIASVEDSISERAKDGVGPFCVKEVFDNFYRANLYSAFYDYPESMGNGVTGMGVPKLIENWAQRYSDIYYRRYGLSQFRSDLANTSFISGTALLELARSFLYSQGSMFDPRIGPMMVQLAARLDSRPAHCYAYGYLTSYYLDDLRLAGELYESVIARASGREAITAKSGFFLGKDPVWLDFAQSPQVGINERADVLYTLGWFDSPSIQAINQQYDKLVREVPQSWSVVNNYIELLRKRRDYQKACAVAGAFVQRVTNPSAEGYFHSRVRQSTNLHLAGRFQEGLDVLDPIRNSVIGQRQAAILLEDLGKKDEAEKLARDAIDHGADDLESRLVLVSILWRNEKYEEATRALLASSQPITVTDWCWTVSKSFGETFMNDPNADRAIRALTELEKAHVSRMNLACFPRPFVTADKHELAFRVRSMFIPQVSHDMEDVILSYRDLREWKGKQEAVQWLRKTLPPKSRNPLSAKAFYEREYDLLWDVIDKPEEGDHPDWVWVYRAAASAMIGPGDPHRKEVEEHFSSAGGDLYHQCGRYLVGKLSEKELLALPKTASDRCAVSFYIAVKAHGEGRYDDASDWYRVALETGADHEGGYNHTINILTRWSTTGQGLWLAKQQKL